MVANRSRIEKLRMTLRAVFYRESGYWVAHCLEMDVMGHDVNKRRALRKLTQAISLQINESLAANNHRNIFMPADARFFEMFAAGKDVAKGVCVVEEEKLSAAKNEVTIERIEKREYRNALAMA